jgi:large subunit ribosomal protein L30
MASDKKQRAGGARISEDSTGGPKIKIQFYRSVIHASRRQKVMVRSLGFTKLNQILERPDTPAMRGAVAKAPHLLRIIE